MGLFGRLRLLLQSEMNGALDTLEDPKKGLDYSLVRLEENLRQARQSLVDILTAQRLLQTRRDQARAAVGHHEAQARAALVEGREDLATSALQRRQAARTRENELEAAAANLVGQAEALRAALLGLQARIELLRSKKEELKAIYDSSRAQLKVREALMGLSTDLDDAGRTIRRAEERVRRLQARAEAVDGLAASGAFGDALEPWIDGIDGELARLQASAALESDLRRLKLEVSAGYIGDGRQSEPAPPALPEAAAPDGA